MMQSHSAPSLTPSPPTHMSIDGVFIRQGGDSNDIYRGQVFEAMNDDSRPISPSSTSPVSSSSTATGRLGALAAIVEQAITHWRNSSTFSLSSSSSTNTSRPERRRRRRSSAADRNARSERDIVARLKARQETRQVPREFVLYVPPVLQLSFPGILQREQHLADENGMLRTYLLPTVLNRLSAAIKASTRLRQPDRLQSLRTSTAVSDDAEPQPTSGPRGRVQALSDMHKTHRTVEGNSEQFKNGSSSCSLNFLNPRSGSKGQQPAWWLDVSSPTNEDMRALGKACFFWLSYLKHS
jgi:magnesium transporter